MFSVYRRSKLAKKNKRRGSFSRKPWLESLEDRTLLSVDIALNPSRSGFPTPLESDRGWGGGSDQWQIVDGLRHYDHWYHGLAFTGGHTDGWNSGGWIEPAGPRQATIDFGTNQTFNEVIIWHHGDESNHVPATTTISYWAGTQWNAINATRVYGTMHEEGSDSGYSNSDIYSFAPVTGSKVRYSFDNSGATLNGNPLVHGWIYEFEVYASGTTHFSVSAPASITACWPFSITVTALDANGNTVTGYTGTVHFTTSDSGSGVVLPADYTFTAADQGVHTFNGLTLFTAGSQTVTGTDTATSSIMGTATVNVNTQFNVNLPSSNFILPPLPPKLSLPTIHLDEFNATFTVQAPTSSDQGGVCSASANTDTNGGNPTTGRFIEVGPNPFLTQPIAFATVQVTVTLFQTAPSSVALGAPPPNESLQGTILTGAHNVWLNQGPGNQVLEWYTPGFKTFMLNPIGQPILIRDTGPLEDWVDLGDPSLNLTPQSDFATIINQAEQLIESRNSEIVFLKEVLPFLPALVITDPGQTELLVTGPNGNQTGMTAGGTVVQNLPGSAYFPSVPLVVIAAPSAGTYDTQIRGLASNTYQLVTAFVNQDHVVAQQSFGGTIAEGQTVSCTTTFDPLAGVLNIDTVAASAAVGPTVFSITQGGVEHRLETDPVAGSSLGPVSFAYAYDGTSGPDPQLTVHVTNTDPANARFDLSLLSSSTTANFDLALLDAPSGAAGIRDISVDGNLLPGGIQLPLDNLGCVAVWGDAAAGAVQAASIQAVAFGSLTTANDTVAAADADREDAAQLLTCDTAIVQADDTYRVPLRAVEPVAFFLATGRRGRFNRKAVLFSKQTADDAPITALVAAASVDGCSDEDAASRIQTIALLGDGGAIQTDQLITTAITSTGPLGDLILGAEKGIVADVTAPSIFGNIDASNGPIAGTIQTTGQRIDPQTGAVSFVAADFGSTLADASGTILCTTTVHAADGISGRLISRGNLVSQVLSDADISGVIAAQGDIGVIQRNPDGTAFVDACGSLVRFGGIVSCGDVSGQIVALGNIFGDIAIGSDLTGRIAAKGQPVAGLDPLRIGILGNIFINGDTGSGSAIVSGGLIGDSASGTQLCVGDVEGILAAKGAINFGDTGDVETAAIYANVGATPGDPNAAAIDAIFTNNGQPLAFDLTNLDLGGLNLILQDLVALQVGSDGNLTGPSA